MRTPAPSHNLRPQSLLPEPALLAAVDLGSNSFHLCVMQEDEGRLLVVDRLKEMVQLAYGLTDNGQLNQDVALRALRCLSQFGQRLEGIANHRIRAVGTSTMRRLKDGRAFLTQAQYQLGCDIDIISGQEEARLIYLGVAHSLSHDEQQRMVIDIGGSSTEYIIGQDFTINSAESLHMGCVRFSRQYFVDGMVSANTLKAACLHVNSELAPFQKQFQAMDRHVLGASGSIKAIFDVLQQESLAEQGISRDSLDALAPLLLTLKSPKAFSKRWGLSRERAHIFVGGFVILWQSFHALNITQMTVADAALREGLVYDLLGRFRKEDVRDRTISSLQARYGVDKSQAARVSNTAHHLIESISVDWQLEPSHLLYLDWGAQLHELGLAISHNHYHRHGAYLIENSDLAGFSQNQQHYIATIVAAHRRKLDSELFAGLPDFVVKLAVVLRLAILLHRDRSEEPLPFLKLIFDGITSNKTLLRLKYPDNWLNTHPLTQTNLTQETTLLAALNIKLTLEPQL